jgi:sporulation protein YlmC with PRC-barrel domain
MEDKMRNKLGYIGLIGGALVAFPILAVAADDSFVKEQSMNQWRASKLVGVTVMGADQKKIGKIEDVLFDHEGNAQVIVVGVGGFLGIGAKDVGVPFKSMQWRTEVRTVATAGPPATSSAGGNPTATPAMTAKTDPAATEASQGYPDMGVLSMTKAQLQEAPDFHYAASPTADAGATASPANNNAAAPTAPKN